MNAPKHDLILLGLGSNLGDRRAHLAAGVSALGALPGIEIRQVSRLYETAAWGGPKGQGPFLNAALTLQSRRLSQVELLSAILAIEAEEGRVRDVANGPRTLDIDILLCGERVIAKERLVVPHVAMHERSFVLQPAAEVAGFMRHPLLAVTVAELAHEVGMDGLLAVISERGWFHALGQSTCK